jgi:hypothetical protein
MPHELLSLRIPPAMKSWLEAEMQRRKAGGERQVNMTLIVIEWWEAAVKAQQEGS